MKVIHCNKCNDGINEDTGLRCQYCDGDGNIYDCSDDDDNDDNDDDEFVPCQYCDGHDACVDFGCAVKLGLSHLIRNDNI